MLKVHLNHVVIMDTCRISRVSVSKNWWKALQKRRKECSLWNRNTHIKKEYSLHHGTGTLIKRNTHIIKRYSSKRNTHQKELINRNTHITKGILITSWNRNTGFTVYLTFLFVCNHFIERKMDCLDRSQMRAT